MYEMLSNGVFWGTKCAYLYFLTKLPPPFPKKLNIFVASKTNKVLEKANDEAKTSKQMMNNN